MGRGIVKDSQKCVLILWLQFDEDDDDDNNNNNQNLPDDDHLIIETCWSDFKCFSV
jgi:hypothetical protein